MNFALGALIVFLLLAPGIVFRVAFLKNDLLRRGVDITVIGELLFALLAAYALQVLGLYTVEWLFDKAVSVEQVYWLITGAKDEKLLNFEVLKSSFPFFLLYTTILIFVADFLGRQLHRLVAKNDRFDFLRSSSEWEKLFRADYLTTEERKRLEFIRLDVSSSIGKEDFLYCGILEKFTLNKEYGLERIILSSVYRRNFSAAKEVQSRPSTEVTSNEGLPTFDDRYYHMPGNYFVIPFSAINNINITYYLLEEIIPANVEAKEEKGTKLPASKGDE